jgi:hypothetical protein
MSVENEGGLQIPEPRHVAEDVLLVESVTEPQHHLLALGGVHLNAL